MKLSVFCYLASAVALVHAQFPIRGANELGKRITGPGAAAGDDPTYTAVSEIPSPTTIVSICPIDKCQWWEKCELGKCVKDKSKCWPECSWDQYCDWGKCKPKKCTQWSCPWNEYCNEWDGKCYPKEKKKPKKCWPDCEHGYWCNTEDGQCYKR